MKHDRDDCQMVHDDNLLPQQQAQHHLEGIVEAPCYYPTAEQFEEPLKYIASIRDEAERYGVCRICPPSGWKPPFAHKPDKLRFATKEQDLSKLAGTQRLTRKFTENLRKFLFFIGKPMESSFGGKLCLGDDGGRTVDMFRLFKDVQKRGGHERLTSEKGWEELAAGMRFPNMGEAVHEAYVRYLSDFEAANSGRGIEGGFSPVVYQERPSVEADLRVGTTLWHYMDEDGDAGRCYAGTVKAIRPNNQCVVEYDRAEREIPAVFSSSTRVGDGRLSARMAGIEGWADALQDSEEVEAFRVTLPRSQLSTLVLNGRSPAAAKLAAHGVVCEVCSIASASNATLAVCVSCDSAYHLGCVEPTLARVPLYDWFCGDCAKDGNTAEALAQGIWAPSTLSSSSSPSADAAAAKDSATGSSPNSSNSSKDPDCETGSQQKRIQQQRRAEIPVKGGEMKGDGKAAAAGNGCAAGGGGEAWTEGGGSSSEEAEGSRENRQDSGSGCDTRSGSASRMRGVSSMKGRALRYGFGNGGQFTLKEFALMADGWRSSYLARRGLGDDATEEEMEAEFWKLVGPDPPEDDVKVLYGSDLDTGAVGSGFPWSRGGGTGDGHAAAAEQGPQSKRRRGWCDNTEEDADHEEYSYEDDTWNLNCLPTADGSLLQFLGTHIQGVMVPWLYVGMAFSAFCWHNEDHYLYSINYLHAGSPKRWYSVPGAMAGQFETAVQELFPELFEAHPDLLMQLVTMAHPSELAKRGVPVASTTQREGEFVLTFPQAYHAGFNMGTNCAEAVNFAPPDWLPWGNAAQERYRVHRRKPVFSHEGLVLSLVDLLTKQSREGVHTSGELYRFLRDEVEVLAVAQEEEMAAARRLGCTRFEPMEKLVERLRGYNSRPATSFKSATLSKGTATSVAVGHSGGSRRRSGDSCVIGHAHQSHGDDGILTAIESASPVQGPQCTVCHQYCFLALAVCDTCHGAAASGRRGSRSGSGSFRRFACGRHLEQLCACPCSSYTFYVRKDAAALRAASSGLSSLYDYLEVWADEARGIIAAVNGGADADPAREAAENIDCAGDNELVGAVRVKGEGASEDERETLNSAATSSSSKSLVAPKAERKDLPAAVGEGGKVSRSQISRRHTAPTMPPSPGKGEEFRSTLLPPRWHERPTLGYLKELIRVGAELGGSEVLLTDLAALVDGCARWTKTVRMLVGRENALRRVLVTTGAATTGGVGSGNNGGAGEGQNGSAAGNKTKRREPAAFHKVTSLLKREGGLPARAPELTEELCSLLLGACDLRKQVRLVLGLGEDESILRITALCLDLQKASKATKPLSLKSRCLILKPTGGKRDSTYGDGVGNAVNCSASLLPLASGGNTCSVEGITSKDGMTSVALGLSLMCSSSASGSGGGGVGAHASRPIGESSGADQPYPTGATAAGGGVAAGVGVVGVAACASGNSASAGVSTGPTGRTRTRTNVSLPTGTLAAERGTWRGQAWRLWPVHQATAIALVESCLSSTVSVPELAPLREGLAALAGRENRTPVKVTSVTLKLPADPKECSSGVGAAPGSKRGGGTVCSGTSRGGSSSGGGSGGGSGVKARRVHDKCDGGGKKGSVDGADQMQQSKKAKALGYAQAGPSRPGVAGGGRVLLGVGMVKNKRRRQDAVA